MLAPEKNPPPVKPTETQILIPSKPKTHPTPEQLSRTPLDVKEALRDRELEWNGVYDALVKQIREVSQSR
jgi:hypothetical protein